MNQEKQNDMVITIKRNNEEKDITITPSVNYEYYLGVYFKKAENTLANNMYYAFFETGDFAFSIFENFLPIRDFTSSTLASFRSVLVGACLPQTLLGTRAISWNL